MCLLQRTVVIKLTIFFAKKIKNLRYGAIGDWFCPIWDLPVGCKSDNLREALMPFYKRGSISEKQTNSDENVLEETDIALLANFFEDKTFHLDTVLNYKDRELLTRYIIAYSG